MTSKEEKVKSYEEWHPEEMTFNCYLQLKDIISIMRLALTVKAVFPKSSIARNGASVVKICQQVLRKLDLSLFGQMLAEEYKDAEPIKKKTYTETGPYLELSIRGINAAQFNDDEMERVMNKVSTELEIHTLGIDGYKKKNIDWPETLNTPHPYDNGDIELRFVKAESEEMDKKRYRHKVLYEYVQIVK